MKNYRNLFLIVALLFFCSIDSFAATLTIGRVTVDNVGMNKRLVRMNDSGILVDNSGLCVEVTVNFSSYGLARQRVVCIVQPLSEDGYTLADGVGEAMSLDAITIPTPNYNGTFTVPLPYQWITPGDNVDLKSLNLGITLVNFGNEEVIDEKIVELKERDFNIDNRNLGGKLMSDVLGSPGDILSSFFGGGDVESTQTCPVCDGTGVCAHCDGDAYFDPSACRKCSTDPGICRRCKGTGTVTIQYDIY